MGAYLGAVGSLVQVRAGSKLSVSDARPMSMSTTLGGKRVAQLGATSRRVWDCSVSVTDAATVSRLQVLRQSVPMPWVWYSAWATRTNLLTPDHAAWVGLTLSGATDGGLVSLEGGQVAPSRNDPSPSGGSRQFTLYYPVVPGVPVTAGVHARPATTGGSVTVSLRWRDAAGTVLSNVNASKVCVSSGPLTRVTVTGTPPANAATCYLVVSGHSVFAGPSLTFTGEAMPWATGAGCLTSVVAGLDLGVIAAWDRQGGQMASYSFTVTEVG